ncbi:MAG: hypothetical protein WC789_10495 [Lentisphaeria bacterium]
MKATAVAESLKRVFWNWQRLPESTRQDFTKFAASFDPAAWVEAVNDALREPSVRDLEDLPREHVWRELVRVATERLRGPAQQADCPYCRGAGFVTVSRLEVLGVGEDNRTRRHPVYVPHTIATVEDLTPHWPEGIAVRQVATHHGRTVLGWTLAAPCKVRCVCAAGTSRREIRLPTTTLHPPAWDDVIPFGNPPPASAPERHADLFASCVEAWGYPPTHRYAGFRPADLEDHDTKATLDREWSQQMRRAGDERAREATVRSRRLSSEPTAIGDVLSRPDYQPGAGLSGESPEYDDAPPPDEPCGPVDAEWRDVA